MGNKHRARPWMKPRKDMTFCEAAAHTFCERERARIIPRRPTLVANEGLMFQRGNDWMGVFRWKQDARLCYDTRNAIMQSWTTGGKKSIGKTTSKV
jgi:hypothetical protein